MFKYDTLMFGLIELCTAALALVQCTAGWPTSAETEDNDPMRGVSRVTENRPFTLSHTESVIYKLSTF